ncbi:MAG: hypothetical protein PVG07_04060 [Acidobacteriota bacterium]|jgi:hypothetical protein
MVRQASWWTSCAIVALILGLAAAPAAIAQGICQPLIDGDVAKVFYEPDAVYWDPQVEHEEVLLRVETPCDTIEKTFRRGETPVFELAEVLGPVDGRYSWELRIVPVVDPEVRQDLVKAHETGDYSIVRKLQDQGRLPVGPFVEGEAFSVIEGRVVPPEETEEKSTLARRSSGGALLTPAAAGADLTRREGNRLATKDVLHYDDVIVTGSLCVGFDCVNGESFGYDTVKIKENNLRIGFDDTSTGSFPTNNWQLRANDSTSGGASYFGIVDMGASGTSTGGDLVFAVEAGAPASSLYVEDYGRVGLGTSIPYVELHIVDGDSPTVRLDQDGSSGWVAQRWDLAGNETNFFIRDVTHGSALVFRIQPDAPSNSLTIRDDGDVGIGTWSPQASLHVERSSEPTLRLADIGGESWDLQVTTGGNLTFAADGTSTNFLLNNNGRVTINSDTASAITFDLANDGDLTIAGDYYSATCTSSPCAPDYVFEPDYELMPLAELEAYVRVNRHLPNIPSADDLAEAGRLNMSRFQMQLLEKVEELTLYTLDQQERITRLTTEKEDLEKRLARLEAAVTPID